MSGLRNRKYLLLFLMLFSIANASLNIYALEVGDSAPDFKLEGSDGKFYQLSDFRDKQFVVIAFFPKAFTGG